MKNITKVLSFLFAFVFVACAFAQEAVQPTVIDQEDGSKLVAWVTVEEAFASAINRRAAVAKTYAEDLKAQQEAAEADKASFDEKIAKERNALNVINLYLNIVFAPESVSEYAFDSATSVVYQKIGTAKEIFVKVIARRGLLDQARQKATDEAEKTRLEGQYQLLQNAIAFVYNIDANRKYEFNADNGVIYLKATAEEAQQILKSLKK